jgi:hypothetical protein
MRNNRRSIQRPEHLKATDLNHNHSVNNVYQHEIYEFQDENGIDESCAGYEIELVVQGPAPFSLKPRVHSGSKRLLLEGPGKWQYNFFANSGASPVLCSNSIPSLERKALVRCTEIYEAEKSLEKRFRW